MEDKIDIDFKKYIGMDLTTAHRVLMEKGITTDDIENTAVKLFQNIGKYVVNKDLDDDHSILFHMMLTYYLFSTGLREFDDLIKQEAAEHNLKPEKYIKIMFGL